MGSGTGQEVRDIIYEVIFCHIGEMTGCSLRRQVETKGLVDF